MEKIKKSLLPYLSFHDYPIESIELLYKEKRLKFFIDGAYLDINNGIFLGKGTLTFANWESISMKKYDFRIKKWIQINVAENMDPLDEICESSFSKSRVILSGFAKNCGLWMEWEITHAKIVAEFEPEPGLD